MITQTTNIDALLRRHLELAIRLNNSGHALLAFEVVLGALAHEPPSTDSEILRFLVDGLLAANTRARPAAADELRRYFAAQPSAALAVRRALEFYVAQTDAVGAAAGTGTLRSDLDELARSLGLAAAPEVPALAAPERRDLPAGVAQGVVVEPGGAARVVRVYVRYGQFDPLGSNGVLGQVVPGAQAALDAARHYLRHAGADPLDGHRPEVLVEGLFRPIQGESLGLAVFMAATSVGLAMPTETGWVFTGAVGAPSVDGPGCGIIPVDELAAKLRACAAAGGAQLMVPAALITDKSIEMIVEGARVIPVADTTEAVERVWPAHRLPASPAPVRARECVRAFLRALPFAPTAFCLGSHRLYRLLVPLFFALMLTERWLVGDYLNPDYYRDCSRAPLWLAVLSGTVAAALLAVWIATALRLADVLLDRGGVANWWLSAALLAVGHVLAWLVVQPLLRDPLAPPPRGLFLEHRTLQWWKDTTALFLYALIFFVSPYTRVRLAERAAAAGRVRWAREILEGRRWAGATFPVSSLPLLIVVASVTIAGLGYLDWQSVVDRARSGADPATSGPWHTIHIIGRAYLYVVSCAAGLWWLARATHRVASEPPGNSAQRTVLMAEQAVPSKCGERAAQPRTSS